MASGYGGWFESIVRDEHERMGSSAAWINRATAVAVFHSNSHRVKSRL